MNHIHATGVHTAVFWPKGLTNDTKWLPLCPWGFIFPVFVVNTKWMPLRCVLYFVVWVVYMMWLPLRCVLHFVVWVGYLKWLPWTHALHSKAWGLIYIFFTSHTCLHKETVCRILQNSRKWTVLGQEVDRKWTVLEQEVNRKWTVLEQEVDCIGSGSGLYWSRKQTVLEQEGIRKVSSVPGSVSWAMGRLVERHSSEPESDHSSSYKQFGIQYKLKY